MMCYQLHNISQVQVQYCWYGRYWRPIFDDIDTKNH